MTVGLNSLIDVSAIDNVTFVAEDHAHLDFGNIDYGRILVFEKGLLHIGGKVEIKVPSDNLNAHTSFI
jgi:hypothetical protein